MERERPRESERDMLKRRCATACLNISGEVPVMYFPGFEDKQLLHQFLTKARNDCQLFASRSPAVYSRRLT